MFYNYHFLVDDFPANQSISGQRMCVECPQGLWADSARFSCVPCGLSDCSQCVSYIHVPLYRNFQSFSYDVWFLVPAKVASSGLCFSLSTALLSPPTGVFQFYSENFAVVAELCRVWLNLYGIWCFDHLMCKYNLSLSLSLSSFPPPPSLPPSPLRLAISQPVISWPTCVCCSVTLWQTQPVFRPCY